MITVKDIAKVLNVSASTIYKSFLGESDISQSTRRMILDMAGKMGYQGKYKLNFACRLRIGVFLSKTDCINSDSSFIHDVISGFYQEADSRQWKTFLIPIQNGPDSKFNYGQCLRSHHCSAGFFLGSILQEYTVKQQMEKVEKPTVLLDCTIPCKNTACVGTNSWKEIYYAVKHLTGLGHKRIAMFGQKGADGDWEQKIYDFRFHMRRCGIPEQTISVFQVENGSCGSLVSQLLQSGFTAVICSDGQITHDVLAEFYRRNVRVPGQISVVGLGDIPLAKYMIPPLTTVQKDGFGIGINACIAIDQMNHGNCIDDIQIAPRLTIRESTGILCVNNDYKFSSAINLP